MKFASIKLKIYIFRINECLEKTILKTFSLFDTEEIKEKNEPTESKQEILRDEVLKERKFGTRMKMLNSTIILKLINHANEISNMQSIEL